MEGFGISTGQFIAFLFFILLCVVVGGGLVWAGSYLGGKMVYRTKRDAYEPFIGGPGKGEVYSIDPDEDEDDGMPNIPEEVEQANENFFNQFMGEQEDKE